MAEKVKTIDPIGKKLKFNLDEGVILIDGSGGENMVSAEDLDADCTISMSIDTWLKLQNKEIKPFVAVMKGKMKVKGDVGLARKLKQLQS